VLCATEAFSVRDSLEAAFGEPEAGQARDWRPTMGDHRGRGCRAGLLKLIDALEDSDDGTERHANFEHPTRAVVQPVGLNTTWDGPPAGIDPGLRLPDGA